MYTYSDCTHVLTLQYLLKVSTVIVTAFGVERYGRMFVRLAVATGVCTVRMVCSIYMHACTIHSMVVLF